MTMPAEKLWARARKATAGVVMTPADSTVAPPAVRPAVRVAAIQSAGFARVHAEEDTGGVAEVMGEGDVRRRRWWRDRAGDWPATPRMPSVPNRLLHQ